MDALLEIEDLKKYYGKELWEAAVPVSQRY